MKILTAAQMRQVDALSTRDYGVPSIVLMENAGLNLYLELNRRIAELKQRRILILCGKGNNGGDGMVLARQLLQRSISSDLVLLGKAEQVGGDARLQLEILEKSGFPVREVDSSEQWRQFAPCLSTYDVIVDAMLGTGLSKPLEGLFLEAAEAINRTRAFILAVDIPTGMPSDSVDPSPAIVHADLTVTFTAPKRAHVLSEDLEALGELVIVPIGSPVQLLEGPDWYLELLEEQEIARSLLPRKKTAHKGDFGHVLLAGGSRGKSGAILLSSRAALRTGSGLVTAAVPEPVQPLVAAGQAEVMTEGLAAVNSGSIAFSALSTLLRLLQGKDALGIGPGLSRDPETARLVRETVRQCPVPMVIDADALNAFEGQPELIRNERGRAVVLTPHPGEFSRLSGRSVEEIRSRGPEIARAFAGDHHVWLVLKGFRTLVATPSGQVYVSPVGNQGMATGGTGDVLTGVLTSLIGLQQAQGSTQPEQVTRVVTLGVFLHGLAGDLAARKVGYEGLTASGIIDRLPYAFGRLRQIDRD
jgi:ADP-dependent NAD(P)H-hydrate dehydratase / NAD(P)H-hydrate epimerase